MKKIIAFAGSNSKNSINKQFVEFTMSNLENVETQLLDLNDFELPLYSIDYELDHGIPKAAQQFLDYLKSADGIVLSLAEHNGSYTVAFKNLFDWMSRIDGKLWSDKPMLLMATAPGARGGLSVLEAALNRFPFMGGKIVAHFSLPFFQQNFNNNSITDDELRSSFKEALSKFNDQL